MKMKQPTSINELYKKARFMILCYQVNINFNFYGNPCIPRKSYEVRDYGNFVIMDTTKKAQITHLINRIEIPKYAPFNHS